MRLSFVFVLFFVFKLSVFSQNSSDADFLIIGKQNITLGEFEKTYNKNNSIGSGDRQSVEEYLPLFINFKLKVQAAIDAGFDTLPSFKTELKGYRDQLAKSYLTDNRAVDSLVREAYTRMHTEVNASHIMISLKVNPSPADTLQAWNKALAIRSRLMAGEPFEKIAFELSEDPSARNNKGNLGYFTAFQMVYLFESAVYNQRVGEISRPVRSRFGYHLIKTNDKRPARGEVKVAHIMLMVPQGSPDSVWLSTEERIKEIAKQIQSGSDFASLAKELSEDRGSARNGGELPVFGAGRMVQEFDQAAFALQNPGDISEPVKTSYGWHLIKLIEKRGIPEFEKIKQELKSRISRDERSEAGSNSFIAKLKQEYNFSENRDLLREFHKNSILNLKVSETNADRQLFSFSTQNYTLSDFAGYLKGFPAPDSSKNIEEFVQGNYTAFVRNKLLKFEDSQLEAKYPEFTSLVQEYHDGILLFNLSDSLIWSKASKDSAGLTDFFNKNKQSYMWPERLEATIVSSDSEKTLSNALKISKILKTPENLQTNLVKSVCDTAADKPCVELKYGKFEKGEEPLLDKIAWKKSISKIIKINNKNYFVVVHGFLEPMPKSLDEARGLAISDYQNYLDSQWIETLRKKYPVIVNNETLNELKIRYASSK